MGTAKGRMGTLRGAGGLCLALLTVSACPSTDNRVQLLELQTTDIARALNFYHAAFGWEASRPDSSYAILDAEPVAIGLMVRDRVTPGGPTIVIRARDLEVILARIIPNGGLVLEPIRPSWQGRQFRFADPDGNELVVWSDRAALNDSKTP